VVDRLTTVFDYMSENLFLNTKLIISFCEMKYVILILSVFFFLPLHAQKEADYITELAQKLHGQSEVSCYGGRADIVTDTYAFEVEFAPKWKNAIGQSLWYGLQLDRKPGIIIVMRDLSERRYALMLQSALDYAGLTDQIKVMFYPEDFGGTFPEASPPALAVHTVSPTSSAIESSATIPSSYWKTTSSGVRHNSTCQYYQHSKGNYCKSSEGRACSKCGG